MDNKKAYDFGHQEVTEKEKTEKVSTVFDSVADKYDLMNDIMSFGPVSYTHLTLPTKA